MKVHRIETGRIGPCDGEQTAAVICVNLLVREGILLIVEDLTANIVAVIDLVLGQRIVRDQAQGRQYEREKSHRTITLQYCDSDFEIIQDKQREFQICSIKLKPGFPGRIEGYFFRYRMAGSEYECLSTSTYCTAVFAYDLPHCEAELRIWCATTRNDSQ